MSALYLILKEGKLKKNRKEDSLSMKESMDGFLKAMGVDKKMHEASVLSQWGELMGEAVAKRTEKKYIKNRILYVELNSSVMRAELMQQRSQIVSKINKYAGKAIIDDVFLA